MFGMLYIYDISESELTFNGLNYFRGCIIYIHGEDLDKLIINDYDNGIFKAQLEDLKKDFSDIVHADYFSWFPIDKTQLENHINFLVKEVEYMKHRLTE